MTMPFSGRSPVEEYGMDVFLHLGPGAVFQVADKFVNGTRMSNETLALALMRTGQPARKAVLSGLNSVRRQEVRDLLRTYETSDIEDLHTLEPAMEKAVDTVLQSTSRCLSRGMIHLASDMPEPSGASENPLLSRPLPHAHIAEFSPEGILGFWVLLAYRYDRLFNTAVDEALDSVRDGFTAGVLALAADDSDDDRFMAESGLLQTEFTAHYSDMLELARRGVMGICRDLSADELLDRLCDVTPLLFLERDRLPGLAESRTNILGSLFTQEVNLAADLLALAQTARVHGRAVLAEPEWAVDDAYLGAGLELLGKMEDAHLVQEVMSRRKDTLEREMRVKTDMTLRAALSLRQMRGPRELNEILGAYLPRPMDYQGLLDALTTGL